MPVYLSVYPSLRNIRLKLQKPCKERETGGRDGGREGKQRERERETERETDRQRDQQRGRRSEGEGESWKDRKNKSR